MNSYKQFWQEHRELGIFLGSVAGALILLATLGMFLLLQARVNFTEETALAFNSITKSFKSNFSGIFSASAKNLSCNFPTYC